MQPTSPLLRDLFERCNGLVNRRPESPPEGQQTEEKHLKSECLGAHLAYLKRRHIESLGNL